MVFGLFSNISPDTALELIATSSLGTLAVQWLAGKLNHLLDVVNYSISKWTSTRSGRISTAIAKAVYTASEDGRINEAETQVLLSGLRKVLPDFDSKS